MIYVKHISKDTPEIISEILYAQILKLKKRYGILFYDIYNASNNQELKWLIFQIRSILGLNGFPGSPLFCELRTNYGLVGILTNQDSGSNEGDKENKRLSHYN